jgi:hypothetical protein
VRSQLTKALLEGMDLSGAFARFGSGGVSRRSHCAAREGLSERHAQSGAMPAQLQLLL